jgi:thiol:disulfide interchange protein DsbG
MIALGAAAPIGPGSMAAEVGAKKEVSRPVRPDKAGAPAKPGKASELPAPIAKMVQTGRGVEIVDSFEAPGGLTGWVVVAANGERRIFYVTPDGKHAIYGLIFDEGLEDLTREHLKRYPEIRRDVPGAGASGSSGSGQSSADNANSQAATEGPDLGPALDLAKMGQAVHVEGRGAPVYIVFDPSCPFCHQVYRDTRQYLDRIQIHWIPVGVLSPKSERVAETFIQSADKKRAMESAVSGKLPEAAVVSATGRAIIGHNIGIMKSANVTSVPFILFFDGERARGTTGAPTGDALARLVSLAKPNGSSKR